MLLSVVVCAEADIAMTDNMADKNSLSVILISGKVVSFCKDSIYYCLFAVSGTENDNILPAAVSLQLGLLCVKELYALF